MRRVGISAIVALLLVPAAGRAEAASAVTCIAVAPAPASETHGSGSTLGHSAPYTVRLTTAGSAILVSVQPKDSAADRAADKGSADVAKILLRSPYKTEATALPSAVRADGTSATATFDAAAVRALPAGPLTVVITTAYGERSCRVTPRQRTQLVHSE